MTNIGTLPETTTGHWFHDIGHYVNPSRDVAGTRESGSAPVLADSHRVARGRQGRPLKAAVGRGRAFARPQEDYHTSTRHRRTFRLL